VSIQRQDHTISPGSLTMKSRLNAVAAVLAFAVAAPGAPDDWAEGVPGRNDGANHTYYNMGARLPWRNSEGDWRDAAGVQQGDKPFAVAAISRDSKEKPVEWDVTA